MRRKLGLGLLAAVLVATAAQSPEATLGAALHEERVSGNMQAAIDGYRKVLATKGVSRSIAAQAQYHIGVCYEKLGNQEARKAFESVVRNYSDQKDIAAQARARLSAMGGPGEAGLMGLMQARLLWDNAAETGGASADGRYLSYTDWSSCDAGLRDLLTGESRKVTKYDGCSQAMGEVTGALVSPDGKRIAFGYYRYRDREDGGTDLRVVAADGTGEKTLMRGGGLNYADPHSWSPDGRWIAAAVGYGEWAIALVSADSGQSRRLRLKDNRYAQNVTFSPDGKWLAYSIPSEGASVSPTLLARAVDSEGPEQTIEENAVMMGWTPDGTALLFSRERGGTHDLYFIPVSEGKAAGAATPIYSSSDVGTAPAGVTRQGTLLFMTSNSRAESLVLPWTGEGFSKSTPLLSTPAIAGMRWHLYNGAAHFSNDGKLLLVVNPRNGITIAEVGGRGERTIVPQLKSWSWARWAHDDAALLVYGKDANGRTGVYRVDNTTGSAALLAELPQINSFTPSRDGKTIYYGTAKKTQARDLATGQDKTLFEAPEGGFYGLRLSHDGYRLAIRGGAYLAVVDLRSGQSREIYRKPELSYTSIWGMDWSADDRQIVTMVRPGGDPRTMECWIFSADGGEPVRRTNASGLQGLSLSPDGKYVATTSMTSRGQLWALENFLPARK